MSHKCHNSNRFVTISFATTGTLLLYYVHNEKSNRGKYGFKRDIGRVR